MEGGAKNIFDAIEYFGPRKKLVYALMNHGFDGFDGFVVSDHVPGIEGDREWGHKVRYADTAYIKGLMDGIKKMKGKKNDEQTD